jgi:hypothetical protein
MICKIKCIEWYAKSHVGVLNGIYTTMSMHHLQAMLNGIRNEWYTQLSNTSNQMYQMICKIKCIEWYAKSNIGIKWYAKSNVSNDMQNQM